ncbi:MAG TPA: RIP metalloprotease RseP [Anaeromyxobacteraceae bacterium]|jgi:regulator of sigma E protease|nr:RIP metalloprotease RseP [Anaeromyxobacteraceae bacterium]
MPSDLLLKIGSIVLLLGGLIFVHELGHFVAAKLLGVKVVRFSIGFGPRLFGWVRGETDYQLALLPLGGYVKMAGDDPNEELSEEDAGRGFLEQKPWRRFIIAAAGPGMNLVFPLFLYFLMAIGQNGKLAPGPTVGTITPGLPAAAAGLQPGDKILSVAVAGAAAEPVRYFADLRDLVSPHGGEPLRFDVLRDGRHLDLSITPAREQEQNPIEVTWRGVIGVSPAYAPAVVAPVSRGAADGLQPFDLVTHVNGAPVAHAGALARALDAAACHPVDLVVRRAPAGSPSAPSAQQATVQLAQVPSCSGGAPAFRVADPSVSAFVGSVTPGGPAARAGLRRGDAIEAVNGHPVRSYRDLNGLAGEFKAGEPVRIELAGGRAVNLEPVEQTYVDDLTREKQKRVVLGFQPEQRQLADPDALLAEQVKVHIGAGEALTTSAGHLVEVVRVTVLGIARIVSGQISFKTVGGPIMLFSIAAQAAQEGLESFLFKMALISVNLGLMNLLPIPVLDGGHLMTCLVEGVTRRRISVRAREIANLVGIVLLAILMIAVFKNDIVRLMG